MSDHTEIIPGLWMGGQVLPVYDSTFDAVVNMRFLEDLSLPITSVYDQHGPAMCWIPLIDQPIAPPLWKVHAGAAFVNEARLAGKKTLVHCEQGRNRSGLITGAYLILYQRMRPDEAIDLIRSKRPQALTNEVFVSVLKQL